MRTYLNTYRLKNEKNVTATIAHLSDIHFCKGYQQKRFDLLYDEVKKMNPDYICITGDLVDDNSICESKEIEKFHHFLERLGTICKVILTLGNHDLIWIEKGKIISHDPKLWVEKLKALSNVIVLDNEKYDDGRLCFVGFNPSLAYYNQVEYDFSLFLKEFDVKKFHLKKDFYHIFLLHTPIGIMAHENTILDSFDLVLCGHTHGGMLPSWMFGDRGIISPNKVLFPHDMRGHKKIRSTDIIICSGIMKLSKKSRLMRFTDLYAMDVNEIKISS